MHTELRVITVSELARIAGPTDTYGPYCIYYSSGGAIVFLALVDKKLGKSTRTLGNPCEGRSWYEDNARLTRDPDDRQRTVHVARVA